MLSATTSRPLDDVCRDVFYLLPSSGRRTSVMFLLEGSQLSHEAANRVFPVGTCNRAAVPAPETARTGSNSYGIPRPEANFHEGFYGCRRECVAFDYNTDIKTNPAA